MNNGIGNNEITQSYYNLSISDKRKEFYNEFYELFAVMRTLIKNKNSNFALPGLDGLDNLKNDELDEDVYMTGLYEDLIIFKELFAYYFDDGE